MSIHLFPPSGFDQSAATPVFLGVLVSWVFTETFGWVFAGLVVPGYLATLFLLDPRSAAIDVLEAVLTYACARAIGEHLSKTGLTSRAFGRERFLLIVIVSVLVRVAVEGVALAYLVPHSTWAYSIGLVIVPLAANACWKTGLARGVVQHGLTTAIVYGLLQFVLVPHTNLSLAGFDLAIENIAENFLASPKTYVLLVTGAVLAAFTNIRYGWDFNGILIPALMALVVLNPLKFSMTIAEVLVLGGTVRLLLAATPVGRWNIEGPRRVVLFFSTDYALRFAFAAFIGQRLPGALLADLTGFGYLLPTLIAVKVSQRGLAALVILPAAAVSGAAFGLGTLLGFVAQKLDGDSAVQREPVTRAVASAPADPAAASLWLSALARPTPLRVPSGAAVSADHFARLIDAALSDKDARMPSYIEVQRLDHDVVLFRERFENPDHRVGDPAVLVTTGMQTIARVVALVPTPLGSPESAALAGRWLVERRVGAVVVAGIEQPSHRSGRPTLAGEVARVLARARSPHAPDGMVIALRRGTAPDRRARVSGRAAGDPRMTELLRHFRAPTWGASPEGSEQALDEDVALELPAFDPEGWPAPSGETPSATSPTALVMMFDGVRAASARTGIEDLLVAHRLVIGPMLEKSTTGRSAALLRASAGALGYRLMGPFRDAGRADLFALLPVDAKGAVAILSRSGGASGLVIEVPQGARNSLRRLAIRLGARLRADAVLVGLDSENGVLGNGMLADAHAAATWPGPLRHARVLVLREGRVAGAEGAVAAVGTWGGDEATALAAEVTEALAELGVPSDSESLRPAAREEAGRSAFGDTPLVAVTVDDRGLRVPSLGDARKEVEELGAFPIFEEECGAVAVRLGESLSSNARAAPDSLLQVARRAALERSVVARRQLEEATAATSAAVGIARASTGVFLVIVGRGTGGLFSGAYPVAMAVTSREQAPASARSLGECGAALATGGTCRAVAGP